MNKKALLPTIIAIAVVIGIVLGNFLAKQTILRRLENNFDRHIYYGNKLNDVVNIIDNYYVDSINIDTLTEKVIPEIIAQLDPHSYYIPAKDLQMANEALAGNFYGIGVQFNLQNDTIYIVNVIAGGPSQKAGIMAGDKIVKVNDSAFVGNSLTNEKVLKTLRGDKDTKVKLGIVRNNSQDIIDFDIIRGEVAIHSVDISYMIDNKVGYISVNKFGETTYKEFLTALTKLKKQGASALIVDLRGNAGGYLGAAVNMLNEFLAKDDLIVYVEGVHQPKESSYADGNGSFQMLKMAVLIDEFSGSASEIFAGAIQDNDRGVIIGRRSFGKGLVQKPLSLKDGSEIRLTIAKYYTPSGRCIQKPYKKGKLDDYEMDIINRFNHGEFYSKDSIKENQDEQYLTRNGRVVYGGGGIMPDIFVPSDTVGATKYFNSLVSKGLTYKFALKYTDKHRQTLNKYTTLETLQRYLDSQPLFTQIIKYASLNGVNGSIAEQTKSKNLIARQVKAYIIRNILDEEGFLPYLNQKDKCVAEALEALK